MATPRRSRDPQPENNHHLWQQVRERRLLLGVTQAELADLAGLSRTTVHAIETGSLNVGFTSVSAVADVLGCDVTLTPRYGRAE